MDPLILAIWPDLVLINEKERTYYFMDFGVPTHKVNVKSKNKTNTWNLGEN